MLTHRLKHYFLAMLALGSLSQASFAQHLWWNDSGCGDIEEMNVYVSSTAITTYYETLGWNQGGNAGGYTGIQSDASLNPLYIFALWNPTTTTATIKSIYANPNGTVSTFSGEGSGLHYLNTGTKWILNSWYKQVVRAWAYNGETYFGMWSYDVANSVWTHHVTFAFPVASMSFCPSAVSFLENWSGDATSSLRHANFAGGWKRVNGKWNAFTSASLDGSLSNYGTQTIGGVNTMYMQTGTATSNTAGSLSIGSSSTFPAFSTTVAGPYIASQNITVNVCGNSVTYAWTINSNQNPPFSYTVQLINTTNNAVIQTLQDTNPETRSVVFSLTGVTTPAADLGIKVTINDIYDQAHTSSVANLNVKSGSVKGLTINHICSKGK